MATFAEIRTQTYNVLGEPSDTTEYSAIDVVDPKINRVVNRICKKNITNFLSGQKIRGGDLSFLRKKAFYQLVATTATTADATQNATTLSLDTSNFEGNGYAYINGDVIQYTGKTATDFTGVTGIDINIKAGSVVRQVFVLPTNIARPFNVYYQRHDSLVEIPFSDPRLSTHKSMYYTVLTDENSGVDLLAVFGNSTPYKIMLQYYNESTDMVADSDICTIPDPFALEVIPALVAGELLWDNEEIEDSTTKLRRGYASLEEMYDYYASMNEKHNQKIQVKPIRGIYSDIATDGGRRYSGYSR